MPQPKFIEEKPPFLDHAELLFDIFALESLVISLAECEDTVQRANDLYSAIKKLHKKARRLLRVSENNG